MPETKQRPGLVGAAVLLLALLAACAPRPDASASTAPRLTTYVAQCPSRPDAYFTADSIVLYEKYTVGQRQGVAVAAFPRTCRVFALP